MFPMLLMLLRLMQMSQGPNELSAANPRAPLDLVLCAVRRRGERSARNVALQLARGRQQLPRA